MSGGLPDGRPAYGFDDDAATRRLLRSRPPGAALAWAAAVLGGPVIRVRALRGGMSSAVHALTATGSDGRPVHAVLRRYVRADLNLAEPDIAHREGHALRFVADAVALPTLRLLAGDPDGGVTGVPMLLMSRLPGRVNWSPSTMEHWLRRLAGLLTVIHAAPVPPPGVFRRYAPYPQRCYAPPAWARWPAVWERAVRILHGPEPPGAGVFLHRDFHPGNVLWRRGAVTGVVDWQAASIGPAGVDVGHCRGNLLCYGLPVADRFVELWQRMTGARYHPWAEVASLLTDLDGLRDNPPPERETIETALARAVAELG